MRVEDVESKDLEKMVIHLFLCLVTQGCRVVGLDCVAKGELHQQLVGGNSSLPGWKLVPQLAPSCWGFRDRHSVQVGKSGVDVERVVVVPTPSVCQQVRFYFFLETSQWLTSFH